MDILKVIGLGGTKRKKNTLKSQVKKLETRAKKKKEREDLKKKKSKLQQYLNG